MPDRAAHPQTFEQSADERQVGRLVRGCAGGHRPVQEHVPAQRGDRPRIVEDDLGGGGAGQLQGAARPGPQPELHDRREGEPVADELPDLRAAGVLTGEQAVDPRLVVQVRRDDRGQRPGVGRRAGGGGDQIGEQVVERHRFAGPQLPDEQRAQRERVRSVGDEPGAVRGVLHRVVEQQRPVLAASELTTGEQLGDRDGGERGEPGTQVADALVQAAGRAAVGLCAGDIGKITEDGDAVGDAGRAAVVGRGCAGRPCAGRGRVPRRVERPDPAARRLQDQQTPTSARDLARGGGDQCPDLALVRADTGTVDLVRVGDELGGIAFG